MRQAKRCFALGTRLRGCDRYLVLQRSRPVCFMKIVDFMRTTTPQKAQAFISQHQGASARMADKIIEAVAADSR